MLNSFLKRSVIEPPRLRPNFLRAGFAPAVGTTELVWSDNETEYRAALWYPAEKGTDLPSKYLGMFPARACSRAAPYGREYPLVLISHGLGGNRYDQAYLAEYLAARGCACLAPSYIDRVAPQRWRYLLDRPPTFHAAYRHLLRSDIAARIDFGRVALIAHSAGAYPSMIGAGAIPRFNLEPVLESELSSLNRFDPTPYALGGVETIILMAPALSNLFDAAGLADIRPPALVIAAEFENVQLLGTSQAYATLLPNAWLHVLEGAGHYAFINEFPLLLAKLSPLAAGGDRRSRSMLHAELLDLITCQLIQSPTFGCGRIS